ncbi:zinc ABC transporter ATP-binding protein AztA [Camelimonas abortus]|uniref:Zinc ABC transporter ATP-binding protein AztA n=1 Tax=Camelimonas abortus TaxID=1017184 RepID=A0ABV7LAK1_9HYPH
MTSRDADPVLEFRNVTLGYDRHPAVHHLHLAVRRGTLTAIVGPNGAGKSTLLKAAAGLLRPLEGVIRRNAPAAEVAWLPQAATLDQSFPLTVYDLVSMGLWERCGLFGRIGRRHEARIAGALAAVGLTGFERRPVSDLSGGQLQRALFARLLLQDARLILLDEPFNALDAATIADLVALVRRWHAEGRTVLAALHDLELVRAVFPETLVLARELVAHGPTAAALTEQNLARCRRMVEAADPHAHACSRAA